MVRPIWFFPWRWNYFLKTVVVDMVPERKDVTGSVASIIPISNTVPTTNVSQALQGRCRLVATQNHFAWFRATICIRGTRSLTATTIPVRCGWYPLISAIRLTYQSARYRIHWRIEGCFSNRHLWIKRREWCNPDYDQKGKAGKVSVDYKGTVSSTISGSAGSV
jgi:hypothetical protein